MEKTIYRRLPRPDGRVPLRVQELRGTVTGKKKHRDIVLTQERRFDS